MSNSTSMTALMRIATLVGAVLISGAPAIWAQGPRISGRFNQWSAADEGMNSDIVTPVRGFTGVARSGVRLPGIELGGLARSSR
ncbi:MAG: hypothetical protein ACREMO_05560, partial [Gemmatimonadales bacterium]